MRASGAMLTLLGFAVSCNFDAAFNRYCENNPQCRADSGTHTDAPQSGDGGDAEDAPPQWQADSGTPMDAPQSVDGYCENNPQCQADSGTVADAAQSGDGSDAEDAPPIPPPQNCSPSNPCADPSEVCHPFGQVCMMTCNTSADCPPWLDTCTEIHDPTNGAARTQKVCTCTRPHVCNGYANGFTCNFSDGLCERLCEGTQDCSGFQPPRVCDHLGCQIAAPTCFGNANCPSADQPRCDPTSLRCIGCISSSDCADRTDGLTQCNAAGACVIPS